MLILSFEIWVYVFYNGLAYEVFLLALCRPQAQGPPLLTLKAF